MKTDDTLTFSISAKHSARVMAEGDDGSLGIEKVIAITGVPLSLARVAMEKREANAARSYLSVDRRIVSHVFASPAVQAAIRDSLAELVQEGHASARKEAQDFLNPETVTVPEPVSREDLGRIGA